MHSKHDKLKIRSWSHLANRWLNIKAIEFDEDGKPKYIVELRPDGQAVFHLIDDGDEGCTVELFTNHIDENGKEIYINDILEDEDGGRAIVESHEGKFVYRYVHAEHGSFDFVGLKKIGDLHNNLSLLA